MSEISRRDDDRAEREDLPGYVHGQRRRIYEVRPDEGMVARFQAATSENLGREEAIAGLIAALNPAAEDAGCHASLLSWHRTSKGIVVDGDEHCPLASDHHGKHITPDGLHVWSDPEDEDE